VRRAAQQAYAKAKAQGLSDKNLTAIAEIYGKG